MKQAPWASNVVGPQTYLAQADLLLWFAEFLRVPGGGAVAVRAQVDALVSETGLDRDQALGRAVSAVLGEAERTSVVGRMREHHRLFEGAMICPPNETAYVRRDKGAILGDLCGFYRAFGFVAHEASGDKPDHLAAELEFMAMLLVMLTQAEQAGEAGAAEVTRKAMHSFAQDHVDPWLALFTQRLAESTTSPLHAALGEALATAWEGLMREHVIPRAEHVLVGEPISEPEDITECGLAHVPARQDAVEIRVSASGSGPESPGR